VAKAKRESPEATVSLVKADFFLKGIYHPAAARDRLRSFEEVAADELQLGQSA
jgi:hypothetical protein